MVTMFSTLLAHWLDTSNQTQARVARALGINPSVVSHWRAGRKLPSPDKLQAFLDYFKATDAQQISAWRLLAEADRARKAGAVGPRRQRQKAAQVPVSGTMAGLQAEGASA